MRAHRQSVGPHVRIWCARAGFTTRRRPSRLLRAQDVNPSEYQPVNMGTVRGALARFLVYLKSGANAPNGMSALVSGAILFWLWRVPSQTAHAPTVWISGLSILVLATGRRNLPWPALAWFLFGLTSLAWSLAPGATLVGVLWSLVYLAAFSGAEPPVLWAVLIALLFDSLFSTASMAHFGLVQYFSGSLSYLSGAVGVAAVPVAWAYGTSGRTAIVRVGASALCGTAVFAALASGSRAVYVALVIVVLGVAIRKLWHGRQRSNPTTARRLAITLATIVMVAITLNAAFPGHPLASAVGANVRATSRSIVSQGPEGPGARQVNDAIHTRLLMWDQALRVGLTHPLGTGLNSFGETIRGFQRYPTISFSSAHNIFIELFATQGWLGLGLMLALMLMTFSRGWGSPDRFPWVMGAAALWLTMAFDVTWSVPIIPALAFACMGVAFGAPRSQHPHQRTLPRFVLGRGGPLVVGLAVTLWWFMPCQGWDCTVHRHLGVRQEAIQAIQRVPRALQAQRLEVLKAMYPKSIWVWTLAATSADSDTQRLKAIRELVHRFPYASPTAYLEWGRLAKEIGATGEARRAVETGLRIYPATLPPAGIPLFDNAQSYRDWVSGAQELLDDLSPPGP